MRWDEFEEQCPEIAKTARDRFAHDELVMLGTLRKDGSPRISPCELDLTAGHLFLGMMWRSPKALDLKRDPRIVVHSVTCNREGTEGDVKLYGRAVDVTDGELRAAYREAIRNRIDWAPDEGTYHLFSLDVGGAAHVIFGGGEERVTVWHPETGLRSWVKRP
ncbi:MAG: pyridoxamine 5'-phosphate oxidase family protein [Actinomycetota bacterium]